MAVSYGYVRVSTAEQNEQRQITAIKTCWQYITNTRYIYVYNV